MLRTATLCLLGLLTVAQADAWAGNRAPTANAGPDQVAHKHDSVVLSGSGSDPDGSIASYQWIQIGGPTVALSNSDQATASFIAPTLASQRSLTFRLMVRDNNGAAALDSAVVKIQPNIKPSADAGPDQTVNKQTTVVLAGNGSDPDGSIASYKWQQIGGPTVVLSNADQATASFVAPTLSAQAKLTFRLTVTDNDGVSTADSTIVTVRPNVKPTVDAGPVQTVGKNTAVTLTGSGSDPDGNVVAYQWIQTAGPSVTLVGDDTATPSFTAPVPLKWVNLSFRLTVTDNDGASASDSVVVKVMASNVKPTVNAGPDQVVSQEAAVTLPGSGSDQDGSIASYQWTQVAGPAVTLSGANQATATFTAPTPASATSLTFRLTVRDNNGATASDDVVVTVNPVPVDPPASEQWVMGYYVSYQRDMYPPDQVDWRGLSHIIMSRVLANADGTLNTNFDWDASNGPLLAMDLASRAHAAGRKAVLMLGGSDNGTAIRDALANHRALFIANLVSAMNQYGYDGIDLDWENDIDWDLFVTFARELRQAAPHAILTVPIGPLNINYDVVEPHLVTMAQYVDRLNMMSYYPTTSWAGSGWLSWYNSPLTGVKPGTPVTIDESFRRYAAAGIAKGKLGMGIGFYATCYTGGITGPNQSTEEGVTIAGGDNDMPLADLYGTNGAYSESDRHWDDEALEPYLSLPQPERHGCRYVSFEDEQSIIEKGNYSRANGYGGTIIWTINQGYVRTHSQPNFLVEALRKGFLEPAAAQQIGMSLMQGNTWVRTNARTQLGALVTGVDDKTVSWRVVESGCGNVDAQGLYTAPAVERTCTVSATSHADPTQTVSATVTISNADWTPSFSVARAGTWWVEITAQDANVASMSIQWSDGSILPLTRWGTQWGTNYPIFVANYGFPLEGGTYTVHARSANNRSASVQVNIPACVAGSDGVCQQ